jgi:hypothetical protein
MDRKTTTYKKRHLTRALAALAVVVGAGMISAAPAKADHGGGPHVSFSFGVPFPPFPFFPVPVYSAPVHVERPYYRPAPVYVERPVYGRPYYRHYRGHDGWDRRGGDWDRRGGNWDRGHDRDWDRH